MFTSKRMRQKRLIIPYYTLAYEDFISYCLLLAALWSHCANVFIMCACSTGTFPNSATEAIPCSGLSGRYIVVQIPRRSVLTLCEVVVHEYVYVPPVPGKDENLHCAKKPVTTMLTYPWKCTVLHCNHLGNTWKPLVLMT